MTGQKRNKKVFSLLESLTAWEWNGLADVVYSPWHNKNERVQQLFELLRNDPGFLEKQGWEEELFQKFFPDQTFLAVKIRHLFTELTRLVETWLVECKLQDNPQIRDQMLREAYLERGEDKWFRQVALRAEKALEKQEFRDADYFRNSFQLQADRFKLARERQNRESAPSGEVLLHNLDTWFLFNRLKYLCEMLNREHILQSSESEVDWKATLLFLQSGKHQQTPGIAIYHKILLTLVEPKADSQYEALTQLLENHHALFPKTELGTMYAFALNFCIRQINLGRMNYLEHMFEVYKLLIERELLFEDGFLQPEHFKNIVTVAVRLKAYVWAEKFIEGHLQNLPPDRRENAYSYNLAYLFFARGAWGKAIRILQQVEFEDVFYGLDSRAILLKSYYEMGEWEPILSLISSFKIYLKRNRKLSDYQRKVYWNLVRFTQQMVRIRLGSRKTVVELSKAVEKEPEIADLGWLQEKMAELG